MNTLDSLCIHIILKNLNLNNAYTLSQISSLFYECFQRNSLWKYYLKRDTSKDTISQLYEDSYYNTYYKYQYLTQINKIFKLNLNLVQVQNVHQIICINHPIKYIPKEVQYLHNLKSIYLDHNNLQNFPVELLALTNLETLSIKKNKIKSIPIGIDRLIKLKKLYLTHNKLTSIPKEVSNMIKLNSIRVYSNKIESLPEELKKLVKLRNLWVDHTVKVPELILNMPKLTTRLCRSKSDNINDLTIEPNRAN